MAANPARLLAFALLAGAAASPAPAQNPAPVSNEAEPRARNDAEMARVAPLIAAEKQRPRIAGTWRVESFTPALTTTDGKPPPMTAASRKLYNQRVADRRRGRSDDPVDVCLRPGTPRIMFMNEPFVIAQTPAKVTFFHQYQHVIRHVFLDGPLKTDDLDPNWQGYSSGRWEGDTLIIETAGFNGKLWMDQAGLPQSTKGKITERIRLVEADTLEDAITVDDLGAYTAPWTTRVRFKRAAAGTQLREQNCAEKLLEFPLREYAPSTPDGALPPTADGR